jgi:RNase adaptor protein for sRNA GlmZ degradation
MLKETSEVVGKLHGVVLLIHNSVEFSDIVDFLNKIRNSEQLHVMYLSLINSYSRINEVLKEHPLESKRLFVVDCVSGFVIELKDTHDCVYRKPPINLEELKELLMKNIASQSPDIVVVDSMSQFINFSMPTEDELSKFYLFLQSLKENIMGLSDDSIILLYDDKVGQLQSLPTISVDLILKLEVIRDVPRWRG